MKGCLRRVLLRLAGLIAAVMMLSGAAPAPELLNHEERQWLASHPVIRLAYEPGYAPITFVDARGQVKGLSVEYVQLL